MLRTALLFVAPAVLIVFSWRALETGSAPQGNLLWLLLLALLPALAQAWWPRVLATLLVLPLALSHVSGIPVSALRPRDEESLFAPAFRHLADGFLAFYDVTVPFDPAEHAIMHDALLAAVFGFGLVTALALGARRPLVASLAVVCATAWPSTLVGDANQLARGALILAVVLSLLAFGGRRAPRAYRPAVVAGLALVAAAFAAGAQPAVAKSEFLAWKGWDFYDKPSEPVAVDFVWDASYRGIEFPTERTTVLTIRGPSRSLYWRAATLDDFRDDRWVEAPAPIGSDDGAVTLVADPLLPPEARDDRGWVRADVRVEALSDDHLVGPATPVAVDPRGIGVVDYHQGGVGVVRGGLERGDEYTVWAYSPRPRPEQLAAVRPTSTRRGTLEARYLEVVPGAQVMPFGSEDRDERIRTLAANRAVGPQVSAYLPLYETARQVVGSPRSEYAAVVALEDWFRREGGFTYNEQPGLAPDAPPLVGFVQESKRGYCQHFAGAMALMLRFLGIPARVAVGFTSGKYDSAARRWTVTDHDAHAWVEVWFNGWGWLQFDPTPSRGGFSNPYSTAAATASGGPSETIQRLIDQARRGAGGVRAPDPGTGAVEGRDLPGDLAAAGGRSATARGGSLVQLLVLVGLALVAVIALAKLFRRRLRYLTSDPRRVAAACRAELAEFLLDQGVPVARSATALELGEAVERRLFVDASAFVDAVSAARFAPPDRARAAAREARRELRTLRGLLRSQLTAVQRARGLVSVRSLGLGAAGA